MMHLDNETEYSLVRVLGNLTLNIGVHGVTQCIDSSVFGGMTSARERLVVSDPISRIGNSINEGIDGRIN